MYNKSPISQKGENPEDSGWILSSVRENSPQKGRLLGKKRELKGIVDHSLGKGGFRNKVWEDDREEC